MCALSKVRETFRKWNYLDNKPYILHISACGSRGSSNCPQLCLVKSGLPSSFVPSLRQKSLSFLHGRTI